MPRKDMGDKRRALEAIADELAYLCREWDVETINVHARVVSADVHTTSAAIVDGDDVLLSFSEFHGGDGE